MKLVSFSVSDYRSITAAYKLPIRQSTVLIGPNNEGKSNILKALAIALGVLEMLGGVRLYRGRLQMRRRAISGYEWEKDFPVSRQHAQPIGESIFNLDFQLTSDEIDDFYQEVKSHLNGTLPIQLTLGKGEPGFKVMKKGPGGPALSKKAEAIAQFIGKRINFTYIPAIRTSEHAQEIVNSIVERELAVVETNPEYKKAIEELARIQKPVLERISTNIKNTLREFLEKVTDVKVTVSDDARYRALRRSYEIVVDDGTPTHLGRKGDGVQSLAALSLMRQSSQSHATGKQLILAIEEPESHLHPGAIHQLRRVLSDIAKQNQVIMTTHCPLFVDRTNIKSNIIVHNRKASPAADVRSIRNILGIRAADNLMHAELVLVTEGEDDKKALIPLLQDASAALKTAFTHGSIAVDTLLGGSNLSYKLTQIHEAMCLSYCFLDHDKAGLSAFDRAQKEGLLTLADVTFATAPGMQESEIEDLYDEQLYSNMLQVKHGVSTVSPQFKGRAKWSDRIRDTFKHQGKPWNDAIEARVKADVAELVELNPKTALNIHKKGAFDALVKALETKLQAITHGKK
jgi:putative ATP-dependent endonuclease of the OLD family